MVNIVFASNNFSHFPGSSLGSVVGSFDATRLPYAIQLLNHATVTSPEFSPVVGDDTWVHFRYFYNSSGTIQYADKPYVSLYSTTGKLLFKLSKKDGATSHSFTSTLYNGTTSTTLNNTVDGVLNQINSVDVKYTVNSLLIKVVIYINKAYAGEITFSSNPNALTKPTHFSLSTGLAASESKPILYSEILIGDEDTRNARLSMLRPAASGTYSEWLGSLATLADDNTSSGMTTVEAAARQTVLLSAYGGAANISNFIASSMTTRGQNSPSKLKHTIRLSGVNYDSVEIPLGNSLEYNLTDYKLNPATSLPWVGSDLSAIESGFLSVA